MEKVKNKKGITLIALVITVIVLLILAGVAISMLSGENGILRQAARAKTQTEEKSALEQIQLAVTGAMTNKEHKVKKEDLIKGLGNYGYKLDNEDLDDNWTVKVGDKTYKITSGGKIEKEPPVVTTPPTTAVAEKTKYLDESSTNSTSKTVVIPEGFRVSEKSNEQKIDSGLVVIAPDGSEFVWIPVDDINTMYEEVTLTDGSKKNVGKLYNYGDINRPITWTKNSRCKEPDALTDTEDGDWVTRDSTKGIGLYQKEKEYSKKNSLTNQVGSSMIWGSQYDQMMIWMKKSEIDVESAIDVTSKNTGTGSDVGTTGTKEKDKLNNVYDLLGNGLEWTLEAGDMYYRTNRRRQLLQEQLESSIST